MKKLTTSEFIVRSRKVHGDYYDYSLVSYVSNHTPVKIICPIHGEFLQQPSQHFIGQGCPLCGKNRKKRLIRGVAYNDTEYTISDIAFRRWKDLLKRCYPKSEHEKKVCQSYKDCKLCKEWLLFSNFKTWFDANYHEGYVLDKDLLSEYGNKIYSPSTCCFLPQELNKMLQTEHKSIRKNLCERFYNKSKGKYEPKMNMYCRSVSFGTVDTEEEAIELYKKNKKSYIDTLAKDYYDKGLISEDIYKAFLKFKVNYE